MQSHPAYYGLKNLGVIGNETSPNNFLENVHSIMQGSTEPQFKMLHPMYVMLQEQSPMGMLRDFKVAEVDMERDTMTVKQFYRDHVSQSLPVVFRNEWRDEPMLKELATKRDQASNDDYLLGRFGANTYEILEQLSPDVRAHMERMHENNDEMKKHYQKQNNSPLVYKRMRIEYGWFVKPTQTFTSEVKGTYASY